jgi:hypothetical protein
MRANETTNESESEQSMPAIPDIQRGDKLRMTRRSRCAWDREQIKTETFEVVVTSAERRVPSATERRQFPFVYFGFMYEDSSKGNWGYQRLYAPEHREWFDVEVEILARNIHNREERWIRANQANLLRPSQMPHMWELYCPLCAADLDPRRVCSAGCAHDPIVSRDQWNQLYDAQELLTWPQQAS